MIRIYKDNDFKVVTKGAYNNFYKPLGYNIIVEQEKTITEKSKKVDKPMDSSVDKRVTSSKRTKKGE